MLCVEQSKAQTQAFKNANLLSLATFSSVDRVFRRRFYTLPETPNLPHCLQSFAFEGL